MTNHRPFFNLYSPALKDMLGVEDIRSVKRKIEEIGIPVHGYGKNKFIYTHEVFAALDESDKNITYKVKNEISKI